MLDMSGSVISIIQYPFPSDHGSQADSSPASSTVGDHVRSPGTDLLPFSFTLLPLTSYDIFHNNRGFIVVSVI